MEIKISIIVPIFNTEKLLKKCLNSIISQTYKYFELILVNDGSTDNSGQICDDYANKDSRIHVIHKSNGGVSSARNAGLEVAKGEYIGFVDSDDYINQYMFETLYKYAIKFSSDIVLCNFKKVYEFKNVIEKQMVDIKETYHHNNLNALKQMYTNKSQYIAHVVPWNKLYKRHLFVTTKYEVGNIYDDETVAHKLLYNSKLITYVNSPLYYYMQRDGSQMNSSFHIKKFDKVYALKEREIYFRRKSEFVIHQKALKHYMETFFWYYFLAKSNLTNIDKDLKKLKVTFDKSIIQILKLKEIGWKQKVMCLLFSISPYLFERVRDNKVNREKVTH